MWAIAINPAAGSGRAVHLAQEVVEYFSENNLNYQVFSTSSAGELRRDLETFVDASGCDGIISVGGDGLAHLVLQIAVPRQIPFAILPGGTGNDIVRSFGWSLTNIGPHLDRVTRSLPTQIDLGNVDSEWFAAILSTGFDSVVNERANTLSWPKGAQRYNLAIALELPRFSPIEYEITTDTERFTTSAMLIAVGNGRSYGGGMYVCPQAQLNDGLFDIMILEPVSKIEFLKVFPKVYSGSHITHPKVKMIRTQKVHILADAVAYADGERIGHAPISAECVPGAGLTWIL